MAEKITLAYLLKFPVRSALGLVTVEEIPKASPVLTSYVMVCYIATWFACNTEPKVSLLAAWLFFLMPCLAGLAVGMRLPILMLGVVVDLARLLFSLPDSIASKWMWPVIILYFLKSFKAFSKV